MKIDQIIELVVLAVVVIATLYKFIRDAKNNNWTSQLLDTIKVACKEAEELYGTGEGSKKQEYVLKKVEEKCNELSIPYKKVYSLIVKLIKEIINGYNAIVKGK